jgi:lysophospholipase L1-like esterase
MMKTLYLHLLIGCSLALMAGCKKEDIQKADTTKTQAILKTPLTDFGDATFRGFKGGLYPDGANQRPAAHTAAGVAIAKAIKPLAASGEADEASGKIVWMSIGMSNTTQETQAFLSEMQTYPNKNPKLVLVDGAEGGQDINAITSPSAPYWNTVSNRLSNAGLTAAQVQVVWYKQAEAQPTDTAFATYPDALKQKYKTVMQSLKTKFPNLKLVYLTSRAYAGYATSKLNPEPFAWYTGWTVKRLIEDQLNGDAALNYAGSNPSSAWLSWGPYLWANGTTPRSDGLTWVASDFQSDGTHPSTTGRQKVAQQLLKFFTTDETTKPWFLKP